MDWKLCIFVVKYGFNYNYETPAYSLTCDSVYTQRKGLNISNEIIPKLIIFIDKISVFTIDTTTTTTKTDDM